MCMTFLYIAGYDECELYAVSVQAGMSSLPTAQERDARKNF